MLKLTCTQPLLSFLQDSRLQKSPTSLLCLSLDNPLRKACIQAISWRPFDMFFLMVIIANSVSLCMGTNRPEMEQTTLGKHLKIANYVFIALFTLEAALKIVALGFIWAPNTYLRDGVDWGPNAIACMPCTCK